LIIARLQLKNFRNYKELQTGFSKGINFIYGLNAQGKTNILEALFFSGCAKSHRTNKDSNMLKDDEEEFMVRINIAYDDGIDREIQITYNKNSKKKDLKINGFKEKGVGELFGKVKLVFFSPEDMMLIKEGPAFRRRQVDIALSQIRPSYFYDLSRYYNIVLQKNNLLKESKRKESLAGTLDAWSVNQAKYAAKVIVRRREYIKEIAEIAKRKHDSISENSETLEISYKSGFEDEYEENGIFEILYEKYIENRDREMMAGTTFIGPHRDDIIFSLDGREVKSFSSQGQQRSVVLSYKMAQLEYIEKATGEKPVLLLDDVFSELDEKRKKYMYDNLSDIQTFITGTKKDETIKEKYNEVKYFFIENGKVKEE
jgi:DNA replication and repair protein RecF